MQRRPQHRQQQSKSNNRNKKQNNNNSSNNNRHYSPPRSSILLYFISGLVFAMTTTNKLEHLGRKKGKYRCYCCCHSSAQFGLVWPSLAWHLAELRHALPWQVSPYPGSFSLPRFPLGATTGLTIAHVNILVSSFSTLPCYSSITVPATTDPAPLWCSLYRFVICLSFILFHSGCPIALHPQQRLLAHLFWPLTSRQQLPLFL